jgi:hypothetical protein
MLSQLGKNLINNESERMRKEAVVALFEALLDFHILNNKHHEWLILWQRSETETSRVPIRANHWDFTYLV